MTKQTGLLPSYPPPDAEAFRFTSARVKVMEGKLLSQADFLRFKNLSPGDRARAVKGIYSWFDGDANNFRTQADRHLFGESISLSEESSHPDLATYFLLPRAFAQVQASLEGATNSPVIMPFLGNYFDSCSISDLPEGLRETVSEAKNLYGAGEKPKARRLMTQKLVDMLMESRFSRLPYFADCVGTYSNLLEVRLVIASRIRKGSFVPIEGCEINGNCTPEQLAKTLGTTNPDLENLEKVASKKFFEKVTASRAIPAGPEVIFGYLSELENELVNASMLLAGSLVALPPAELEMGYGRAYVS
ncbi:MAG: hypothetical protein ABFD23_00755 [Caldisericales bacterium]|nr:hypothetical protein [bacterium]